MNNNCERMCRMCMQYFCCRNCKSKHETTQHQIFEDCELCIYGRTIFKSPSEKLLQHIKNKHLPLHCLFCKTVFSTLKDLLYGHGCSGQKNGNKNAVNENYQSPVTDMFHKSIISSNKFYTAQNVHYSTSTPMQKNDNGEFKKIPEVITPVEYYNRSQKSHIEPIKCHDTPISSSQANSIKVNMTYTSKEDTNIGKFFLYIISFLTTKFSMDCGIKLNSLLYKDSNLSKKVHCGRTKAEAKVENILRRKSIQMFLQELGAGSQNLTFTTVKSRCFTTTRSKPKVAYDFKHNNRESLRFYILIIIIIYIFMYTNKLYENIDPNVYSFGTQTTKSNCESYNTHTENAWTTVANAWKSAWKSLSNKGSEIKKTQEKSIKRPQSDDSDDAPELKRFKIADVQCRKTIHAVPTLRYVTNTKRFVLYYDKAVQTD
ncbi:hypothetical protein RN001_015809 [Aquatica leii]|uniref:Uncharacterized protein n=1 Tax=Aquatica leii TaxID=1421715 RepID=A0AAN7PXR9_9COLE|nr:hypothetical protein RN001_015809 [Aquatica leii]